LPPACSFCSSFSDTADTSEWRRNSGDRGGGASKGSVVDDTGKHELLLLAISSSSLLKAVTLMLNSFSADGDTSECRRRSQALGNMRASPAHFPPANSCHFQGNQLQLQNQISLHFLYISWERLTFGRGAYPRPGGKQFCVCVRIQTG